MPGERDRLVRNAFHQVAVGAEHIGVVVDDVAELRREVALGDRHADRVAEPLAERAGGGLDAGRLEILRMPWCVRAELAEVLDLIDRHRLVAEEIEHRIEQHRAVAGREHEAVAVRPLRIGRIEFQELGEQHGRDVGRAHRQAGMPGLRLLHRIHRQRPDGVCHAVMLGTAERCQFTLQRLRGRIHGFAPLLTGALIPKRAPTGRSNTVADVRFNGHQSRARLVPGIAPEPLESNVFGRNRSSAAYPGKSGNRFSEKDMHNGKCISRNRSARRSLSRIPAAA